MASQNVVHIINDCSAKFSNFMTGKPGPVINIFSPQNTLQGKIQMYSLMATFLRREGCVSSSDRFLSSAVTLSRSLYDDLASPTSFDSSLGLWLLAFAMSSVDSARAQHVALIARSTANSIKHVPAHVPAHVVPFLFTSISIMQTSQVYSVGSVHFNADFLAPLRRVVAPLLALDPSTIDFEQPELLIPVNFDREVDEATLLLLQQHKVPNACLPITTELLRTALVFFPFAAREAIIAYCGGSLHVFQDLLPIAGTLSPDSIPRETVLALGLFCVQMRRRGQEVANEEFACELRFSLGLFFFFFYQSLGNLEKAKGHASSSLDDIIKIYSVDMVTPMFKVVSPAYIIGLFMVEQGMRHEAVLALELVRSFADRYPMAKQGAKYLEERLQINTRKRSHPLDDDRHLGAVDPPKLQTPATTPAADLIGGRWMSLEVPLESVPPELGWWTVVTDETLDGGEGKLRENAGTTAEDTAFWTTIVGEQDPGPFEVDFSVLS